MDDFADGFSEELLENYTDEILLKLIDDFDSEALIRYLRNNDDINFEYLLKVVVFDDSYLDLILKKYKEMSGTVDIKKVLDVIAQHRVSNDALARTYIVFANYDLLVLLPPISKPLLMREEDGKRLIDLMLEHDEDMTVDRIIPPNLQNDMDISLTLGLHGIDSIIPPDINIDSNVFIDTFLKSIYDVYLTIELEPQLEAEVNEIKGLFNDGKSDTKVIDIILGMYKYLIKTRNKYALDELRQLKRIKLNNPDFCIKSGDKNSYYHGITTLFYRNLSVCSLSHEMGHVLHLNLARTIIPQEIVEPVKRCVSNPETLKKLALFSNYYHEIKDRLRQFNHDKYFKEGLSKILSGEEKEEIEKFLQNSASTLISLYTSLGYDKDLVTELVSTNYSLDRFIQHRFVIEEEEVADAQIFLFYGNITAVSGIIDAMFLGKFHDGELVYSGNRIKPCSGHGSGYFKLHVFDEMIANYISLLKSRKSQSDILLLREIVGNEVVDVLHNYYETNILRSTKYEEKREL